MNKCTFGFHNYEKHWKSLKNGINGLGVRHEIRQKTCLNCSKCKLKTVIFYNFEDDEGQKKTKQVNAETDESSINKLFKNNCGIFRHSFTEWFTHDSGDLIHQGVYYGYKIYQIKYCIRCNKVKKRSSKTIY